MSRSSPNRSRTARTGAKSQPGWIFSLIRTYPAATYPSTDSRSAPTESWMPTDTPQGPRSLVAPSSRANERPAARSSASSTAVSMAALDIQCPLNAASAGPTAAPSTCPREKSLGSMNRLSTSTDASTYSAEYSGSDRATPSPQPSDSPADPPESPDDPESTARSSRMSRVDSTPNDVRNGATSGMEMRRSSTPVNFISRPFPGNHVPAVPVEPGHPRSAAQQRRQHVPQRRPPRG